MKRIITIGIIVLATNAAMAQKTNDVPISTETLVSNGGTVGAQVKSHSNGNNNRQADNAPKVGTGTPAGDGTKKKLDLGKWFKKK